MCKSERCVFEVCDMPFHWGGGGGIQWDNNVQLLGFTPLPPPPPLAARHVPVRVLTRKHVVPRILLDALGLSITTAANLLGARSRGSSKSATVVLKRYGA